MNIIIPKGGSKLIATTLTPQQPNNGLAVEWNLVHQSESKGIATFFDKLEIEFPHDSSSIERKFERCILIVTIDSLAQTEASSWCFALNGVQYSLGYEDSCHEISTTLLENGKTLALTITDIEKQQEEFKFGFVAMHTDIASGENRFFVSKDPIIVSKRRPS